MKVLSRDLHKLIFMRPRSQTEVVLVDLAVTLQNTDDFESPRTVPLLQTTTHKKTPSV